LLDNIDSISTDAHDTKRTMIRIVPKEDGKAKSSIMECSLPFIVLSLCTSALIAFGLGTTASSRIMQNRLVPKESCEDSWDTFPVPQLIDGKTFPDCISTNKYFDSSAAVSSLFLPNDKVDDISKEEENQDVECNASEETCSMVENDEEEDEDSEDDDEEHLPAGQHLLVDVINVDKDFLNSEVRLAHAMMQVVNQSKLTLLSYHCHTHVGVSCVGVLLESHIAFHTWPDKGVLVLDLFTCGGGKLVPLMPLVESLFVVPQALSDTIDAVKKPFVNWSHKLRGFRTSKQQDYIFQDIGSDYERSNTAEKNEIVGSLTDFQRFHVIESFDDEKLLYASYLRSQTDDGSYESEHPELYRLERILYLEGVMQSSRTGIEAYHEALVHPAMFAHKDPKRVAIIGGGECATLREVLKHNTLEHVKMIDIDEKMVGLSREHLPDWSDCSDIEGSADWCGDDDRASLYYEDALAWFNDRFSEQKIPSNEYKEEAFDVLIMDALDPEDDIPFADMLYTSDAFFTTLYNALSDDGIIVFQLGEAPADDDAPEEQSNFSRRQYLADSLGGIGFESVNVYAEGHAEFGAPWSFLVAMKSLDSAAAWHRNLAEINLDIHKRIIHTRSGTPTLKHFDGSTMEGYRVPNIIFENAYCKRTPIPESCLKKMSIRRKNVPITNFEVKNSNIALAGRGVFAKVDIDKGSYIGLYDNTQTLHVNPMTLDRMWKIKDQPEIASGLSPVLNFCEGYGWETSGKGLDEYFVDSGIFTFINHGCNGTYSIDDNEDDTVTEQNAELSFHKEAREKTFDPFSDRHYIHSRNSPSWSLRDIKAGEEILCNYLHFVENKEEWFLDAQELKRQCNGESGLITNLEQSTVEN